MEEKSEVIVEHAFKFTSKAVEQTMLNDLQILNSFPAEGLQAATEMVSLLQPEPGLEALEGRFSKSLSIQVLSFIARQSTDPDAELKQFCFNHSLSFKTTKCAITAISFFFAECLKRNMAVEDICDDLIALGSFRNDVSVGFLWHVSQVLSPDVQSTFLNDLVASSLSYLNP